MDISNSRLKNSKYIGLFNYDLYLWTEFWSRYILAILDLAELNFIYVYVTYTHHILSKIIDQKAFQIIRYGV